MPGERASEIRAEDIRIVEPLCAVFRRRLKTEGLKYTPERATVSVWHSYLFGLAGDESKNPVSEAWYTKTYELRWTEGDWKVVDA